MRILVIEDEHKIANSIKKGLEQELFAVDVAYTGNTGYDFAVSEEYELLILDRLLPEMDGIDICQKLRSQQIHTPVLMLTAKGQLSEKVEGLNAGADDYLPKPFAFEELLARVKALLRRPHAVSHTILQYADIMLDTITYTVTRNKKIILLSHKEFILLEYFLRHPNQVITKEQIMNHVWDYNADILPNTVEAYIKLLRSKIDKPFEKKLIHTVRGFGYKLSEEEKV